MSVGIVLFSDDFEESDRDEVARALDQDKAVNLCVLLASGTVPDFISGTARDKFQDKVFEIPNTDFISGFHLAKEKHDSAMCQEIKVICTRGKEVDFLCQVFFTPAIQWNVVSIGERKVPQNETLETITEKVKDYFSNLKATDEIKILQSSLIPDDVFFHGFSTRTGGLSTIPGMKSLNMVYTTAKRDPRLLIQENRRRLAIKAKFDVETLYVAKAVHGNTVYEIGIDPPEDGYDGVTSNKNDVTCAAPGADCVIILFADPVKRAFAAVHSGWKGTVLKIPAIAVQTLQDRFGSQAKDILVVMGPSICKNCFDFGKDDVKQFENINPNCVLNKDREGNPTVDLKLAIRTLLQEEGVLAEHIDDTTCSLCTVEHPDQLFSYRRDGRPFGNQIGFIGLRS